MKLLLKNWYVFLKFNTTFFNFFCSVFHLSSNFQNTDILPWQNGYGITGAYNEKYQGRVVRVSSLTSLTVQKPKLEIIVDLKCNTEIFYEPGDAFYFIVPNVREEVDFILER